MALSQHCGNAAAGTSVKLQINYYKINNSSSVYRQVRSQNRRVQETEITLSCTESYNLTVDKKEAVYREVSS